MASEIARKAKPLDKVTARYERQPDSLWRARVEELPDVYAAARSLQGAKDQIRVALSAHDSRLSAADVVDQVELSDRSRELVESAIVAREQAAVASSEALQRTRAAAAALLKEGLSLRDVGSVFGVSHTRIQQLLDSK